MYMYSEHAVVFFVLYNRILNGLKTNIIFSLLSVKNWELGRESINFDHDVSIMVCHETLLFAISHLLYLEFDCSLVNLYNM